MCMYIYLLDISRQLACMKLGRREKYQPIQYCWAGCLGYPVHTCYLPIDIQQIYCSAQTGQHLRRRHSCCPVWAVQHIYTLYVHNDCTLIYILHACVLLILSSPFLFSAPPTLFICRMTSHFSLSPPHMSQVQSHRLLSRSPMSPWRLGHACMCCTVLHSILPHSLFQAVTFSMDFKDKDTTPDREIRMYM